MPRQRSKTGIYDAIVRMMRRASAASPVTKKEIAVAVNRRFSDHATTQIEHSVQQIVWYPRKPDRKQRNAKIERLLKAWEAKTIRSRPLGFYITRGSDIERGNGTRNSILTNADRAQDIEQRKHVFPEIVQRSPMLAALIKAKRGYRCEVCRFKFDDLYGDLGAEFLEAHHLVPTARKKQVKWDASAGSLAGLCANCHRMMHRLLWRRPIKNEVEGRARVKELRRIVQRNRGG